MTSYSTFSEQARWGGVLLPGGASERDGSVSPSYVESHVVIR